MQDLYVIDNFQPPYLQGEEPAREEGDELVEERGLGATHHIHHLGRQLERRRLNTALTQRGQGRA